MLDSAGASSSSIETFANAGISVRRETVTKHKKIQENTHNDTVGSFVSKHVRIMYMNFNLVVNHIVYINLIYLINST